MSVLEDIQAATAGAVAAAGPAVVGLRFGWRSASGVVVAPDRVLTSAHAVRGDEAAVLFAGGRRAEGRPVGVDAAGDVAVLAVETGDTAPISWDGPEPQLGTAVFALARLGDGGMRVTAGAVSALGRTFRGPRGRRIAGSIEHTAAVARGSAGGPLVDVHGRLVGVNTVRLDGGLVLALAAGADLRERVEALARGDVPARRGLGVGVVSARVSRRMRRAVGLGERDGLLVREVVGGGPADAAGIQPGDLIVTAGGRAVASIDDLHAVLDATAAEPGLRLGLVRGEAEREVDVVPAEV
jgi:S1-C subfamily serine protease